MGMFTDIIEKNKETINPTQTPSPSPSKGFSLLNIIEETDTHKTTPTILPEIEPAPSPAEVNPELYQTKSMFEEWKEEPKQPIGSQQIVDEALAKFENDPIQAMNYVNNIVGGKVSKDQNPYANIQDPTQINKAYSQLQEIARDKELVSSEELEQGYKQSKVKKGMFTDIIEKTPPETPPYAVGHPPPGYGEVPQEPLRIDQVPTEKLIDIVSIPNYVVGNIAYDAINGGDFDIIDDVLNAVTLRDKKTWVDVLDKVYPNMPQGLKFASGLALDIVTDPLTYISFFKVTKAGQQFKALRSALMRGNKISPRSKMYGFYQDLLGRVVNVKGNPMVITDDLIKQGLPMGSLAELGFVGAVNLDPGIPGLTNVNVPLVKGQKAWELWDDLSTMLSKSEPYVKAVNDFKYAVGSGDLRKVGESTEDWINYRRGIVEANESIQAGYKRQVILAAKQNVKPGQKVDDLVDAYWGEIQHQAEKQAFGLTRGEAEKIGRKSIQLPKELNHIVAQTKILNEELYLIDQVIGNTYAEFGELDYVLHSLKPDVKKAMNINSGKGYSDWTQKHASMLTRKDAFRGYTTTELNWLWRNTNKFDEWFSEIAKHKDEFPQLWIENTALNNAIRYEKTANALATSNFFDEMYELGYDAKVKGRYEPSNPKNLTYTRQKAPDRWVRLDPQTIGKLNDQYKEMLTDVYFSPEVAHAIDRTVSTFTDIKETHKWLKYYDEFLSNWKKLALSTPGWNIRNVPQIAYCAYIDDVSPQDVWEYARFVSNPKGGKFRTNIGKTITVDDWFTEIQTWNMTDSGLFGRELKTDLYPKNKIVAGVEKVVDTYSSPFFYMNSKMENHARGISVYKRVKEGMSFRDAIREVRALFGDPSNIPEFSKGIKEVFPFWGWTQYNIPFQISSALHQPGKAMVLQKYFRDKTVASEIPEEARLAVPEWARLAGLYFEGAVPGEDGRVKFRYGVQEGVNPQFDAMKYLNFASSKESTLEGGRVARLTPLAEEVMQTLTPVAKATMAMLHIPVDNYARIYNPNEHSNFLGFWMENWKAEVLKVLPPLVTINNLNLGYVFGNEELGKPSIFGSPAPNVTRDWRTSGWKFLTGVRWWETDPIQQTATNYKKLSGIDYPDLIYKIKDLQEEKMKYDPMSPTGISARNKLTKEQQKYLELYVSKVEDWGVQMQLLGIDLTSLLDDIEKLKLKENQKGR